MSGEGLTFGDMEAEIKRRCENVIGKHNATDHAKPAYPDWNYDHPDFKTVTDFAKKMHELVGAYFPRYRSWFEADARRSEIYALLNVVSGWRNAADSETERTFCTALMARLHERERNRE